MKKFILTALITLLIGAGCAGLGFSNVNSDLYKNMVNASVMISNDSGYGSGVFIDDDVILTAAHCLKGHPNLVVELTDGTILEVNDIYIDDEEDVGFVFIKANELSIAKISIISGDVGDIVYLVGAPYDRRMKFTITKGILSHLDRDAFRWEDLLQTDAESGPGSSGGPLYDSKGNVIGICVANPSRTRGGGVSLCENADSILEAYERCMELRNVSNEKKI